MFDFIVLKNFYLGLYLHIFIYLNILILLSTGVIYFVTKLFYAVKKEDSKIKEEISNQIELFIDYKISSFQLKYTSELHGINILLSVLSEKLTKYKDNDEKIKIIKDNLVQKNIMPTYLAIYNHKSILQKYYLSVLIGYSVNPIIYEKLLIPLIGDETLIINVNASMIGLRYPSKEIVHAIIKKSYEDKRYKKRFTSTPLEGSEYFKKLVYNEIKNAKDPFWKISAYSILNLSKEDKYYIDILENDSQSNIGLLVIKAIKALAEIDSDRGRVILKKLLLNDDWRIRNKVIKCLENTNSKWGLDSIANCIFDNSKWVRATAINALIHFESAGLNILNNKLADCKNDSEVNKEISYYLEISKLGKL